MACDSQDPTRRKDRRSSTSDDSLEPSKRRKHRHRRRSRKHIEDEEEVEMEGKREGKEEDYLPPRIVSGPRLAYDDMEEGEIVEDDEGFNGGDSDAEKRRADSYVESDELRAGEARGGSDDYDTGVHKLVNNRTMDEFVGITDGSNISNGVGFLGRPSSENSEKYVNGDVGREMLKESFRPLTVSQSPGKCSRKQKGYCEDGFDSRSRDWRKSSSSGNNGYKHEDMAFSPSHDRYHEKIHSRNRSESHDRARERSRSRSVVEEASSWKATGLDDSKIVGQSRDYRHDSRDLLGDNSRERSSSYRRYAVGLHRHHSREAQDRGREGSWDTWDKDSERREVGRGRKREEEQDWDKEREKSRDRDKGREGGREKEKDREQERESRRQRQREKEREWEGDSGRDRIRGRERAKESDRFSRHRNYDNNVDDGDIYDRSEGWRHDETNFRGDRTGKNRTTKMNPMGEDKDKLERDEDEQEEYQERIALQLVDQEDEDINRIKEESRRRRQAILEKYKIQQLQQQHEPHLEDKDTEHVEQCSDQAATISETIGSKSESVDASFVGPSSTVEKSPRQNGISALGRSSVAGGLGEGTPKSEKSDDMFCDDIFGESPAGVRKIGKGDGLVIERSGLHDNWDDAEGYYKEEEDEGGEEEVRDVPCFVCVKVDDGRYRGSLETGEGQRGSPVTGRWPARVAGDWAMVGDGRGRLGYRCGEILDGRYEVTAAHGKGVFSTVVRAKDLKAGPGNPDEVAIKIIRNNEHMHKAGKEELIILKKLVGADPDNKRHCVRFLSSFKYRNHLCLVFESLHMNLREVLKKFGRNIGLKLTAVRTYAKQLFIALKHLRNCGVLHCDIKPDNMLVNEAKNVLKLCDFGNAMFAGKNDITPYLVSRFYRAPEIILGLPYDHPMDIWSVGCCLFELYAGKVLFPGATNNDMLRLHMELKGPFPKKMIRKGGFTEQHFDQDLNFLATEEDPVTKKTIKRLIPSIKPKDIGAIVTSSPGEDLKMLANFRDLLEKVFVLDPDKRITSFGTVLGMEESKEMNFGMEACWWSFQGNVYCFY
ncbi:hypothetical protein RHMOL_Rhmol09G0159900 [Rhododendron molle]|uniref:Uncharacterized protein n=1 Tax=Rhododendron molle TaxID=49168 RepID=A0ACC0ME33_RHOML|nr:hypothetical protein RHMOL_Rhmol09G0159900 [Rhododendron molle]